MLDSILRDFRFALRGLVRQPLFTSIAVLTLALGIGANTAIFSFVYGLALRPLPYPEPDRLMTVWEDHSAFDRPADEWTGPATFRDWQAASSFDALAAWGGFAPNLTGIGTPERISARVVTEEFFDVLGVRPAQGRSFAPEEMVSGGVDVVVVSHAFWQRRLGGASDALSQVIELNGSPHTVIGIMPEGFDSVLVPEAEIWVAAALPYDDAQRGNYFLRVIGRLADGVSPLQAEAELETIMGGLAARFPAAYEDIGITIESLHDRLVGGNRPAIHALFLAVAAVLLIACANVANLLLARASTRRQEMALRTSLGAGRARILQQLVTEGVLLALVGGGLGVGIGAWGVDILRAMLPAGIPRLDAVVLDAPVLLFALGTSVVTGLVFGVVPALGTARTRLAHDVNASRDRGGDRFGGRLRAALVVGEVAFALVLLVSAGLLIRSVWSLLQENPGFEVDGRLVTRITLPDSDYGEPQVIDDFWQGLLGTLADDPNVRQVAATDILPMDGGDQDMSLRIDGAPAEDPLHPRTAWYRHVTVGYFKTMGIRVVAGRAFQPNDREGAERVVVVNERFVQRHLPEAGVDGVIGRRVRRGRTSDTPWMTIVGVVDDVQQLGLGQAPRVELFRPSPQRPRRSMVVVLEATDGDPMALAPALRSALRQRDANLPLASPRRMADVVNASVALPRLVMQLLGAFAALALALAAIGIYGLTAYAVARKTREIGIRVALGARGRDVRRLLLRRSLSLTGLGIVLGLGLALAAGRLLTSLLHGVSPQDPLILAATATVLMLAATLACWLPARRATRIDPMRALREE